MPPRKYAVRVRLQEDRVLNVKQKFFCDRTTEKTVHLQVCDVTFDLSLVLFMLLTSLLVLLLLLLKPESDRNFSLLFDYFLKTLVCDP